MRKLVGLFYGVCVRGILKLRKAALVVWGALLALVLCFGGCCLRQQRIDGGFERLSLGDTRDTVIAAMGRPSQDGPCGQIAGREPNCAHEFVYHDQFLLPDGYIVEFDGSGHVIYKYYYSSP
jgi:hypothetical protein